MYEKSIFAEKKIQLYSVLLQFGWSIQNLNYKMLQNYLFCPYFGHLFTAKSQLFSNTYY